MKHQQVGSKDAVESLGQQSRFAELDCVKGIAILMVILIHASDTVFSRNHDFDLEWFLAMVTTSLSRVCVPWFVIVSGFLVLNREKTASFRQFYCRRFTRILCPFMFWLTVHILWRHFYQHEQLSVRQWLVQTVQGPVYYHLWFLYMIVGLYLAAPFLSRMLDNLNDRQVILFLVLWFCLAALLPWAEWLLEFDTKVPIGIFGSYFGYFLFGGWIRRLQVPHVVARICGGLSLVLVVLTILGTTWISRRDGDLNQVFLAYLAPNIVLLSLFSIIWLMRAQLSSVAVDRRMLATTILTVAGRNSFSIYGSHVLIMQLVGASLLPGSAIWPMQFLMLGLLTATLCFGLSGLLGKLPNLRWVTG